MVSATTRVRSLRTGWLFSCFVFLLFRVLEIHTHNRCLYRDIEISGRVFLKRPKPSGTFVHQFLTAPPPSAIRTDLGVSIFLERSTNGSERKNKGRIGGTEEFGNRHLHAYHRVYITRRKVRNQK